MEVQVIEKVFCKSMAVRLAREISSSLPRHQQKNLVLTQCQVDIFYFCLSSNLSSI